MYVPDNYDQWQRHEQEQERMAAQLPKCDYCEKTIDDHYYLINGEIYCEGCLNENFRMAVEVW